MVIPTHFFLVLYKTIATPKTANTPAIVYIFFFSASCIAFSLAFSLAKVNLAENAPRYKMPIASKEYVNDITAQFIKSAK